MTVNKEQPEIVIGPPRMTRFEKARIVGARALQISLGAPLLIKRPNLLTNPIDLALKEFDAGVLPITIRRKLPGGEFQDIPIQSLQLT